ncbi:putative Transcriptional regulator, TetR family [Nostocoides japonicum T1-X7]|uniref:Putative Transcriptional regulator, TetR family n=1 Tax=Nostocoides japonicum T1-X7 TaxID=1194083 RepID=A0A077M294_9MICO|nr:TetR/AcrR family transcriptional regulator [Tetrasphaera japonica]CCH79956.1 putative Transcriptional regulator, TetR family [Tetrasphaera japonica T1-X7]
MGSGRRAGRPAEPVLTRADIARAAHRRLTVVPPRHLRMSDLAADLDVRTASLYNHVANKDDVLNAVRDIVGASMDRSTLAVRPWPAALRSFAHSYVEAFLPLHPEATAAIAVLPMGHQPAVMRTYDAFCTLLGDAGWPVDKIMPTLLALESLCIGSVLDRRSPPGYMTPDDPRAVPAYAEAYAANLAASAEALDLGLDALIDGLLVRYPVSAPDPNRSSP